MNYIRGAFSAASQYYKDLPPINPSTLTGAIDVIVVNRPTENGDTELACTPFHVRFGKWQILRPGDKKVDVLINGAAIPFNMKIGEAGEAFFVFETDGNVPDDLITSPLVEATVAAKPDENGERLPEPEPLDLSASHTVVDALKTPRPSGLSLTKPPSEPDDDDASVSANDEEKPAADGHSREATDRTVTAQTGTASPTHPRYEHHTDGEAPDIIFSKGMALDSAGYHTFPVESSPLNDNHRAQATSSDQLTLRPAFRSKDTSLSSSTTPNSSRSPSPDSSVSGYSPHSESLPLPAHLQRASSEPPEGNTPSAQTQPQQHYSWEWGAFPQKSAKIPFPHVHNSVHRSSSVPPEKGPDRNSHHFSDGSIGSDGLLTTAGSDDKQLLLRVGERVVEFELSLCGELSGEGDVDDFQLFADHQVSFRDVMESKDLVHDENLVIKWNDKFLTRRDGSPQFNYIVAWRNNTLSSKKPTMGDDEPMTSSDEREERPSRPLIQETPKRSWSRWWRLSRSEQQTPLSSTPSDTPLPPPPRPNTISNSTPTIAPPPVPVPEPVVDHLQVPRPRKRYAKTLRLTSDQLKALNLRDGPNTITFSISSGVVACSARIFVWQSNVKVVVSDIDGTITKSDALGHVFTMIGRDWTHMGVAKLYTDIVKNGYNIMYLTSRAIGQADSTRDYLKSINQDNYQLPEGPVIMSPDRLMASLHREVIMRKPEVFKMACLRDIQRLFGEGDGPFYAGFGNRITDALSYRSVNVPSARIFTIDSSSVVKMELLEVAGYQSSYIHMSDLVDSMFPPVTQNVGVPDFTDFNYWRQPVQEFELPDLTPPSPALSAQSEPSTLSRLRNFSLGRPGQQFQLPPPAVQKGVRRIRQMTSLDRIPSLMIQSEHLEGNAPPADMEGERDRRARRAQSVDGLPYTPFDHGDMQFGHDHSNEPDQDAPPHEEEDHGDDEFDDEIFAAGEMENIPFL